MAEPQPRTVNEGATAGDVEEVVKAKSAEDRKAAAALASMDANGDGAEAAEVDAAAVSKAMKNLGTAPAAEKKEVKKVKVDAADVALLVDELELAKPKATELLKAHDGDAVRAMRAFISEASEAAFK
ncbi:hypothetical protein EKO27_g6283 [Xylaria grammica]|uniref:Nascent polypeptide-associated complex subunit alpha-like UBA domain-containing protein n=1 Tax=Xylaria grammica TaxID=363999 RepID=A0A439D3F0_9PEZI|nr:hypothetical protein EKO27_g6283 [Xylaria grammica]